MGIFCPSLVAPWAIQIANHALPTRIFTIFEPLRERSCFTNLLIWRDSSFRTLRRFGPLSFWGSSQSNGCRRFSRVCLLTNPEGPRWLCLFKSWRFFLKTGKNWYLNHHAGMARFLEQVKLLVGVTMVILWSKKNLSSTCFCGGGR